MIRFSHRLNTWQLHIGAGCWMTIDADYARRCAGLGYEIAEPVGD